MPKPSGGFRALSMLEEGFKALEGPVTKRLVERRRIEAMQLYSSTNQRPLCRIPSDYEMFLTPY